MRRPLNPTAFAPSSKRTFPAPVRGINLRDNPFSLRPDEALDLVNFIAYPDRVDTRLGSELASATPNPLQSVMGYISGATVKIFGSHDSAVYDVSTGTYATAFACTNADYASFNFAAGGANYLYAMNGVDAPQLFDGTSWQAVTGASTPIAITGFSTTDITTGVPYNERLFFLRQNQKSFYYLPVGQVGGALAEFPVGRYLARGGHLVAISVVSFDGGDGPANYLVMASSEGEVLLYVGTDPSSSSAWRLVGSYFIGRPLNKHAFLPYGADTLYLCEAGLFGVTSSITSAKTGNASAISDKISSQLKNLISLYGPGPKWRLEYTSGIPGLILNTPDPQGAQYFFQSKGGGWSRFTAWKAHSFAFINGVLYFGGDIGLFRAFSGNDDNGTPITSRSFGSPQKLAGQGMLTEVVGIRAWFRSQAAFQYGMRIVHDLAAPILDIQYSVSGAGGLVWNQGNWNQANWAGSVTVDNQWHTPEGYPSDYVALGLQIFAEQGAVSWLATDWSVKGSRDW